MQCLLCDDSVIAISARRIQRFEDLLVHADSARVGHELKHQAKRLRQGPSPAITGDLPAADPVDNRWIDSISGPCFTNELLAAWVSSRSRSSYLLSTALPTRVSVNLDFFLLAVIK